MIFGITGTREGATDAQLAVVLQLFRDNVGVEVHHGDCVGADEQVHWEAVRAPVDCIVVHPPEDERYRAFCAQKLKLEPWTHRLVQDIYHFEPDDSFGIGVQVHRPKSYRTRNQDIVSACDELIVVPKEFSKQDRGGTWMTYRMAQRVLIPRIIIWPDGTTTTEVS